AGLSRDARERVEELVRAIVGLHGRALERILETADDALGEGSPAFFDRLCADRFVESVLVLHGLHPLTLEERVERALETVRPYLGSHKGGVEIVSIEPERVVVRMQGSCDGCSASAATVKMAIEREIFERVPEIREVVALGVTDAPENGAAALGTLRIASDAVALDALPELDGHAARLPIGETAVLLARHDGTLYAYRDRCAGCGGSLDGAALRGALVACPGCALAYDLVRAGRSPGDPARSLEPFPIVVEDGRMRVVMPLEIAR
ncbi:MAG: NifU family protein, partial [Vulcanimicrobiaceae bacterium]